jgi:hypothetical protein
MNLNFECVNYHGARPRGFLSYLMVNERLDYYRKLKNCQREDPYYTYTAPIDKIPENIKQFLEFRYVEIPDEPKKVFCIDKLLGYEF